MLPPGAPGTLITAVTAPLRAASGPEPSGSSASPRRVLLLRSSE